MVLTASQQVSFFEYADHMGLNHRTRVYSIDVEGIGNVDDLADWYDDDWDQWASNCKKPDRIQDPNNAANLIAQVPFPLYIKSLKRLNIASKLIWYYKSVLVPLTVINIKCNLIDNFEIQRKSVVEKSKHAKPDIPKFSNNSTVAKWDESVRVYASQVYGARKSTLEYLIRAKISVAMPHSGLAAGQPHSAEAGSIQGEQALRLSHTHPLYRDDNKSLFAVLEVALYGTTFEASIKPFQRTGNGRGAYEALISQHVGKDKWINIIRDAKTYVNGCSHVA